jgi:hypothetical protein
MACGWAKRGIWLRVGEVRSGLWALQQTPTVHLTAPHLFGLGSSFPSSYSSKFIGVNQRRPEWPVGNVCDRCLKVYDAGFAAMWLQIFWLFIHFTKYLLSTCFVLNITLGAGATHGLYVWSFVPNLTSHTKWKRFLIYIGQDYIIVCEQL